MIIVTKKDTNLYLKRLASYGLLCYTIGLTIGNGAEIALEVGRDYRMGLSVTEIALQLRRFAYKLVHKNTSKREPEEATTRQETEEPRFQDIVIFYNFVFDIGKFVNPTQAARALLKEDFTLASTNYLTDDIEIASRFKRTLELRQQAHQLSDLSVLMQKDGLKGSVSWLLRHPKLLFLLIWTSLKSRSRTTEKDPSNNKKNLHGSMQIPSRKLCKGKRPAHHWWTSVMHAFWTNPLQSSPRPA